MNSHACDVLVVGCGPTGVVLANLLGALGTDVVVLERQREVYPVPRATHIDEETVRNFQATGLIDDLLPFTSPFRHVEFTDGDGRSLFKARVERPETEHGYRGSRFFDQPEFERILRRGLSRYANVRALFGAEATSIDVDGDWVTVDSHTGDGDRPSRFRARWAVACDGGGSLVRRHLGIEMEAVAPASTWVIVDALLEDPAAAAQLPDSFRYVFDDERLTIYAHGFGANRRWEFQLGEGEEEPPRETVLEWVSRYADLRRLRITRVTSYTHNALIARSWRSGRVLLSGDAAHMMPPSAGQGMCSGIRDAINLAWKLHCVVDRDWPDRILDSYETERRPHVREILDGTLAVGRLVDGRSALTRLRRSWLVRLSRSIPGIESVVRAKTVRTPRLRTGFLDDEARLRGQHVPQTTVVVDGEPRRLDDVVGYGFSLLVDPRARLEVDREWTARHEISILRPGVDVEDRDEQLTRWLSRADADFALVRPDRIVFSSGRAAEFPRVRRAFDEAAGSEV